MYIHIKKKTSNEVSNYVISTHQSFSTSPPISYCWSTHASISICKIFTFNNKYYDYIHLRDNDNEFSLKMLSGIFEWFFCVQFASEYNFPMIKRNHVHFVINAWLKMAIYNELDIDLLALISQKHCATELNCKFRYIFFLSLCSA